MCALADGDRAQAAPIFEVLWPIVRRSCGSLLGDGEDAEDAAQNAMIRLFAQAPDYDRRTPVVAWALEIAWWECRTAWSRRRRDRTVSIDDTVAAALQASSHESHVLRRVLLEAVGDALQALPDAQRAAVEAWVIEADTPEATGALARKRRQRGLQRLREFFGYGSSGGESDA